MGGAGAAYLIFSTASGTGTGARVRLPYTGSAGDAFGSSLALEGRSWTSRGEEVVGDVRIWVGIPGRDVAGQTDAGAVAYYRVTAAGQVSGPTVYTQNSPGVPGDAEAGDRFGEVLAPLTSGVLVGQPREDVGTETDAGMLTVLPAPGVSPSGPGPYAATEETSGMPGAAEAGDRLGAAFSSLSSTSIWVGAPGEDVAGVRDTGMVHKLAALDDRFQSLLYLSQDSPNVASANEQGDNFGASLQVGLSTGETCIEEVAIGAPGEDLGEVKDAGMVSRYPSIDGTQSPPCALNQGPAARAGDRFGATLGRFFVTVENSNTELIIGIPGQDVGSARDVGAVQVGNTTFTFSGGSQPGDRYGSVIATLALNYN